MVNLLSLALHPLNGSYFDDSKRNHECQEYLQMANENPVIYSSKNRVQHCVLKQDCKPFRQDDHTAKFFVETIITNIFCTAAFSCERFIEKAWIELFRNVYHNGLKFSTEELRDALLF